MTQAKPRETSVTELERVTIRFAGDSGDGMQLTGSQFTRTAAAFGNDISTFPDFPVRSGRRPARWPGSRASRSASARRTSTRRATSPTSSWR